MDAKTAKIYNHLLETDPFIRREELDDVGIKALKIMAGLIARGLLCVKEPGVYEPTELGRTQIRRK